MRNNKDTTLIEIMVVVAIIGILAALTLSTYQKSVENKKQTASVYINKTNGTVLFKLMEKELPVVNEFEIKFMTNGEFVSANRIIRYQEVQGSTVTVESVRQSDLNSSEAYAIIRLFKDKLSMIQDNETIMVIEKFIIEEQE